MSRGLSAIHGGETSFRLFLRRLMRMCQSVKQLDVDLNGGFVAESIHQLADRLASPFPPKTRLDNGADFFEAALQRGAFGGEFNEVIAAIGLDRFRVEPTDLIDRKGGIDQLPRKLELTRHSFLDSAKKA